MRRSSGGGGALSIKSIMQREYLTMGAGAVAAGVLTPLILSKATFLPGRTSAMGQIAYAIGLPVAGALLVQRFNKDFAKGMLLAGIVVGVNTILEKATSASGLFSATTPIVSGASAYLNYTPRNQIAAAPGYSAVNSFSSPLLQNAGAFADDPWMAPNR
jgi:hypothetical protein